MSGRRDVALLIAAAAMFGIAVVAAVMAILEGVLG